MNTENLIDCFTGEIHTADEIGTFWSVSDEKRYQETEREIAAQG